MAKFNYIWNYLNKSLKDFGSVISPYVTSGGGGGGGLRSGGSELTLTDNDGETNLTFSAGTAVIETTGTGSDLYIRTIGGDDVRIEAGDDIRLIGGQGIFNDTSEGGDINIDAGNGSDGNTEDAGSGGDVRIQGGEGGISTDGSGGYGGSVNIYGGYSHQAGTQGGDINLIPGSSIENITGYVYIGGTTQWSFDTHNGIIYSPTIRFSQLPSPGAAVGVRAMITDSTVVALGNFGTAVTIGDGSNIIPVFSNGTNWLIG
jgi:hypothetical protein